MATTWADIQKLAADLQRVQSADSAKKLSEGNCVEIISTLISNGAINVVVTTNGKEYVTKKHLVTEVKNECLAAGGRINITELVPILRIELDHIESASTTLINEYPDEFVLCMGELVSREYINDLCKRLNDSLEGVGQLSMYQLAKNWDLPTDLLNHYILANLGTQIDATRFEDQIYTKRFYQLQRNKLRAALISLTKPTVLSTLFASFEIPQALFFNLWSELADSNQLNGHLIGSKNSLKSVYVPKKHDLLVREYMKNAFLSNGFVETSTLKKLSIANVQSYFKEILDKEKFNDCIFLQSGVVHRDLWQQTIKAIEEHVQSDLFCSIEQQLPPTLPDLSDQDIESLVVALKKSHPSWCIVSGDEHIVYEQKFIEKTLQALEPWLQEKAKEDAPLVVNKIKDLQTQQAKKTANEKEAKKKADEDDDDWGNEKSSKKKGGKGGKKATNTSSKAKQSTQSNQQGQSEKADISSVLKLNTDELEEKLQSLVTVPDSLFTELIENLQNPANQKYKELVEATIRAVDQADGKDQRKSHEEKRLKAQLLYDQICVFEAGLAELPESLAADLQAYLLRSLCADFCAQSLSAFADTPPDLSNISAKLRDELIASVMEDEAREILSGLFASQRDSMEQFHEAVQKLQDCSFMIRQPDKRRRSDLIAEHKDSLQNKIETIINDAPTALLLIVLYLFAKQTGDIIHASGKFVGPLIKHLSSLKENQLSSKLSDKLNEAQRLVVECVKKRNSDEELKGELNEKLEEIKAEVLN